MKCTVRKHRPSSQQLGEMVAQDALEVYAELSEKHQSVIVVARRLLAMNKSLFNITLTNMSKALVDIDDTMQRLRNQTGGDEDLE